MDETDHELHIPFMHYCGPGTRLDQRLDQNNEPTPGNEPVDRVDEAALKHDLFYNDHPNTRDRLESDKALIEELKHINNPTCREKIERTIAIFFLRLKIIVIEIFLKLFTNV